MTKFYDQGFEMHPFETTMNDFGCTSYSELYSKLEFIANDFMGLDGVPFSLSALEHPPADLIGEMVEFVCQCNKAVNDDNSDEEAIKLIQFLKENPPKKSYENPKVPDTRATKDEKDLIIHMYCCGIDLPGSKHNPFGHLQYYSSFFIDMFFGNYTEFNDHIKNLSNEDLQKAMTRREGYCQFNPIFAPILGHNLLDLETRIDFTSKQIEEIRSMYSGCNEHQYLKIMEKLIELGVDVKANDINGYTPLHYAVRRDEDMVKVLLKHGANPNAENRIGWRPLTYLSYATEQPGMNMIDILIQHNAKLTKFENDLRYAVETYGSKDLAVRVREAHPREKEECEKCIKPAEKKCSACKIVYYCTPSCQKLDWKFHKISCQRIQK